MFYFLFKHLIILKITCHSPYKLNGIIQLFSQNLTIQNLQFQSQFTSMSRMNDNEPVLYRDNFGLSEQPQKGLIERFIGNRLQSFAV